MTAVTLLDEAAQRWPRGEAIVFGDERVTFADFRTRADRLARGLAALGLGRGDKVAIWLPNRPLWFVLQQACARLGAIVVALNPRYRAHELSYILGQSGAAALVLTDHLGAVDYFETLHGVLPELAHAAPGELEAAQLPALRHVIVDAEDPYPGCHRLADVLDAASDEEVTLPAIAADDVFTLLYTSGTTSFPKGAMISHRNCVPHGRHCGERLGLTPRDRVLSALPAPGTWGGLNVPLATWSRGAALVLMDVWDPLRALQLIERERCTVWNAVDSMVLPLLEYPGLERFDRSSLRTGGFAATGGGEHGFHEAIRDRIGVPFGYQPYGMTEVNALALLHDLDEPFETRVTPGIKTPPGIEARVAHPESGALCTTDEEGELQFRGALVTRGYYDKPEETAAAFTADGWFKSGDLGVRDGRGFVIFKGRLKETLRISHHMVAPGEIEAFLIAHPAVSQAFVVGIPDPRAGEVPVAYVIVKDGARVDEADLVAWCRGKIASYKIPRGVRFVQDVPRTPGPHGDKVQRVKLREMAREEAW
ncbi:MAG: AMP-binding protein [Candidatus Rokubacteria bacterium]|nr:AMP-binding protein [Candidatus Rokubacteria bacterium]